MLLEPAVLRGQVLQQLADGVAVDFDGILLLDKRSKWGRDKNLGRHVLIFNFQL
jgi:hypothetical protein